MPIAFADKKVMVAFLNCFRRDDEARHIEVD